MTEFTRTWPRLFALVLDIVLLIIVCVLVCTAGVSLGLVSVESSSATLSPLAAHVGQASVYVLALCVFVGAAFVLGLLWSVFQRTPGLALMGAQIVDSRSGHALRLSASTLRAALLLLLLLIPPLWLLGLLIPLRADHAGLHDLLSNARVTDEDEGSLSLDELSVLGERGVYL